MQKICRTFLMNLSDIPDESVDAYTIAFDIRTCTHMDKAVKQTCKVFKKGGYFMCFEFSKVNNPLIEKVCDICSFDIIPDLGQIIDGNHDSYQYLVESIRRFSPQEKFAQIIRDAGFMTVGKGYKDFTFGVQTEADSCSKISLQYRFKIYSAPSLLNPTTCVNRFTSQKWHYSIRIYIFG